MSVETCLGLLSEYCGCQRALLDFPCSSYHDEEGLCEKYAADLSCRGLSVIHGGICFVIPENLPLHGQESKRSVIEEYISE